MSHTIYNEFLKQLALQTLNLKTDVIKVALMPASYVANRDTHINFSDISSQEVPAVSGYTAGGKILTNVDVLKQDAADNVKVWGDDVTWDSSSITAQYAVLYKSTGDPATSPLVISFDFGGVKTSVNGDFTIQWADDGIFTISQAV